MDTTKKIVQLQRNHRTKRMSQRLYAMTGCSIVVTIDVYHIGGNVMVSTIVAMAAMKLVVPIIQCRRP